MKRSLSLILILALLFSAMLCIIPSAADLSTGIDKLKVEKASLEFGSNVHLLLAVNVYDYYLAIGGSSSGKYQSIYYCWADKLNFLKLTVNGEEVKPTSEKLTINGAVSNNYVLYKYENIGAKNIGDEFDIKVYYIRDGVEILASQCNYGAVDYALDAKTQYPDNEALINVLDKMLAYGGAAQTAFNHTGSYDLTAFEGSIKDQSVVVLHGNATFASGAKKAFIKAGQTLTATAESSSASWVTKAAQQVAPVGKTATIAYTSAKQDIYAIDSDIYGVTPFIFDMDKYTGEAGAAITATGTNFGPQSNIRISAIPEGGSVTLNPGYMTVYKNVTLYGNNDVDNNAFASTLASAMASNDKTFTISYTLATDTSDYAFGTMAIRTTSSANMIATANGDGTYTYASTGIYEFLRGGWGNDLGCYYDVNGVRGTTNQNSTLTEFAPSPCVPKFEIGVAPTEFATIHVVFDLVNHTAKYYVGDTLVKTLGVPVSADALSSMYLQFTGNGKAYTYIKSIVLTKGDFVANLNNAQ